MDYVQPADLLKDALKAASRKASLATRDLLIRCFLAGGLLAYATSLVFMVLSQNIAPTVGAILFPVGFLILVLLGLELATRNFVILPAGWAAGGVSLSQRNVPKSSVGLCRKPRRKSILRVAVLFRSDKLRNQWKWNDRQIDENSRAEKTIRYMALGLRGWESAFVKGVLCNWMATLGAVLAMASRSTIGEVVAMWLPIMTFLAHGYEHSLVNMFVIPTGMSFGAPVSLSQWWIWNQIPVTLGNFVSGALLTGVALYATNSSKKTSTLEIPLGTGEPARVTVGEPAEVN